MKVGDLGARTHLVGVDLGPADLVAFANQHYAEALMLAQTPPHHVEVARFEDPQRQRTVGKEHDIEREQRERIHLASRTRRASSSLSCRPPKPPLLITSTWSPATASAANPSTRAATVPAKRARGPNGASAARRSQSSPGGFRNHTRSACASAGASSSRCTPSFMVFERGSSTAMIRASGSRSRKPESVASIAVG